MEYHLWNDVHLDILYMTSNEDLVLRLFWMADGLTDRIDKT